MSATISVAARTCALESPDASFCISRLPAAKDLNRAIRARTRAPAERTFIRLDCDKTLNLQRLTLLANATDCGNISPPGGPVKSGPAERRSSCQGGRYTA